MTNPAATTISERGKRSSGILLLVLFFCFGVAMCSLTLLLLLFPGGPLDAIWRIKSTARDEFAALGNCAIPLMTIVGAACAWAAIGLAKCKEWGRRVAIAVLTVNILGDCTKAVLRADWRTWIGLPIGGLMILYLMNSRVRGCFHR
jgi:sterol desaturase/sphingolipid hydroxylase (fatty acid hydroxylase superfamily)